MLSGVNAGGIKQIVQNRLRHCLYKSSGVRKQKCCFNNQQWLLKQHFLCYCNSVIIL